MSSPWEVLHQQLLRSLATKSAAKLFADLQKDHAPLAAFTNSEVLLDFMVGKARSAADLDRKDQIARALVLAAQNLDAAGCIAEILLDAGLWPLLSGIFHRSTHFAAEPREVASNVIDAFTQAVHSMDAGETKRVISTLFHNTGRRLVDARRAAARMEAHEVPLERMGAIPCSPSASLDSLELLLSIEHLLGSEDANLLIRLGIFGFTPQEIADMDGVPLATMHKRIQRARFRFEQRAHETLQTRCPLFPRSTAIRE